MEFIYNYLTAICSKSTVVDLSFRCAVNQSYPLFAPIPVPLTTVYPLLAELTSLERLSLDSAFVTPSILEVIGKLPSLKYLNLGHRNEGGRILASTMKPGTRKFPSIIDFRTKTDTYNLTNLLQFCFGGSLHQKLSCFTLLLDLIIAVSGPFGFEKSLPQSLEGLTIDFISASAPKFDGVHLKHSTGFTYLQELHVLHPQYLRISKETLQYLLSSWPSLRILSLQRNCQNTDKTICETESPSQFKTYSGPGMDLSILSLISIYAPKLEILNLSVLTCETHSLAHEMNSLSAFRNLKSLKLTASMLNWKCPGFDIYDAASYLSVLPSHHDQLIMETLRLDQVASMEALHFETDYNSFTENFKSMFKSYMKLKACLASRRAAGLD